MREVTYRGLLDVDDALLAADEHTADEFGLHRNQNTINVDTEK